MSGQDIIAVVVTVLLAVAIAKAYSISNQKRKPRSH